MFDDFFFEIQHGMKLESMIFYEGISIVGLCSIDIEILKSF